MDRRKFIVAGLAGTAAGCGRARSSWRFFTMEEARTLEAACAHIIPEDQDAGAVRAGVVVFIDRQLTGFYKPLRKVYREGLAAMGSGFADLPPAAQLDKLRQMERDPASKPFFDMLVAHTMQGYYGDPRHGGNRDRVSWKMLGVASPPIRGRA
ncbi:MAG TPA: gluconate 2-dehydrogenase subunit 3 family protein [Bryobacteraceae bacterium]|nr:gluconate 2-dehydrogenase subunit 3 family protein [Bryobacteraceae bacterium]